MTKKEISVINNMKNILYWLGVLIVCYLILDFIGFVLWALSGQKPPVDLWYFGKLFTDIISFIINLIK